jgi:antitoxin (DNA-binding transcriptional repressor) of toxin-antitoxin stability system
MVTATELRQNIYRLLDEVLETGEPLEIERRGRRLRIVRDEQARTKLDRLTPRPDAIVGDPQDLVHLDWSDLWAADLPDEPRAPAPGEAEVPPASPHP